MSDNLPEEPPLPVLTGRRQPALSAPVVHRVQIAHILRDIFFLFGVIVATYLSVVTVMDSSARLSSSAAFMIVMGIPSLLLAGGYTLAAGWGHQPRKIRLFRLLADVFCVGGLSCVPVIFIFSSYVVFKAMALVFTVNLVIAGIGLLISFVTAPPR